MLFISERPSLRLIIFAALSLLLLAACNDSNQDDFAYVSASVSSSTEGQSAISNKTQATSSQKNTLPDGITRVDISITDSNGKQVDGSLPVGPQTETIKLRVAAHVNLTITMQAFSGDVLSFEGNTEVSALRPGQSHPLSVTLDDVLPPSNDVVELNFSQTQFTTLEGDDNTRTLSFIVTLSALANGNVSFNYSTSGITASSGSDYIGAETSAIIPAGLTSLALSITVNGDTQPEPDETFTLDFYNVSSNATAGVDSAIGVIISDDFPGRLNDTGVTLCADYAFFGNSPLHNNDLDCSVTGSSKTQEGLDSNEDLVPAGQDAHFGRDASTNDDSDGAAGFSFTKLDAAGQPLADQTQDYATQPWACVKDNYTGLTWEVKTTSGLQDATSIYSWYNSTGINDAGFAGLENGGTCTNGSGCDTEKYVNDINALSSGQGICGLNNWRLPTTTELLSIVNNGAYIQAFDGNFFPNMQSPDDDAGYWSSNPQPNPTATSAAMGVSYFYGTSRYYTRLSYSQFVRLVHEEPIALF